MEFRYGTDPNRLGADAEELVKLIPDALFAYSGVAIGAVQSRTKTILTVFVGGGDASDNGFVRNLARPEGNATGFPNAFNSLGGKWLGLLKEAAPHVTRVALIGNPDVRRGGYMASIEARRLSSRSRRSTRPSAMPPRVSAESMHSPPSLTAA